MTGKSISTHVVCFLAHPVKINSLNFADKIIVQKAIIFHSFARYVSSEKHDMEWGKKITATLSKITKNYYCFAESRAYIRFIFTHMMTVGYVMHHSF